MGNRGPTAARLVEIHGRVQEPVDPVGEPSQDRPRGQAFQHPLQALASQLDEVLTGLHGQMTMLEHEGQSFLDLRPDGRDQGCLLKHI
jgi:hypothetical protein